MIMAFKKVLSQINDYNKIEIKEPSYRVCGGYTDITFEKFNLLQVFSSTYLCYKSTRVDLTWEEWMELDIMVRAKKKELQCTESNKDYVEILNIIKGGEDESR